jgi:hypothetical protein
MNRNVLLVLVAALGACASDVAASDGAQLLVPFDIEFSWNEAYNEADDGLVAVLPLDVMVYDGATGEPLFAELEVSSVDARFLEPMQLGAGAPGCEACVWDAFRDEYVEFPRDAVGEPVTIETDADGFARLYALVDVLPEREGLFDAVPITVALGDREEIVYLKPR